MDDSVQRGSWPALVTLECCRSGRKKGKGVEAMPPRRRTGHVLELFKGTGSVGRVFEANGFQVTSLDMDARWNPDIRTDILKWDYQHAFKPGAFDYIWASPPCTEYSAAMTMRPRNLRAANRIVRRTLDIIAYLQPYNWFLENPATGLLKNQRQMLGIPRIVVGHGLFCLNTVREKRPWGGLLPVQ
jgi:hypothetical protein